MTFDPNADLRATFPRFTPEAMTANKAVIDLLREVGARKKATPAQIALAWCSRSTRGPDGAVSRDSRCPCSCSLAWAGFIIANSIAGALASFPERAGAVSALVGAIHYGTSWLAT